MTIRERLATNLTGLKMLALYLWLGAVVLPVEVGYMLHNPRVTEPMATMVVQITAGLIGALMGLRLWGDIAGMKGNGGNGGQ